MLTPNNRGRLNLKNPQTIAECWITNADFPNLEALTSKFGATATNNLIIAACAMVNNETMRFWNKQTADQVFINENSYFNNYQTYVMENAPLNSIADVYIQSYENFIQLSTDSIQIMNQEGVTRVYPFIQYGGLALTQFDLLNVGDKVNLWIRYESGYDKADVPFDIKYATALMTSYLGVSMSNPTGISEYSTQTYRQKNAMKPDENPVYNQAMTLLEPYKRGIVI